MVLIPLGIWTLAGLIVLWPGDVSKHVNADAAGYSVAGVSYPRAEITAIDEISCDGLAGSTPGGTAARCANVTARLLEGEDKGATATVPLTQALYASGTKVGQTIKLIRVPPGDGQPAQYQFSDFERRVPLTVFALIFAAVVIAVARWRGFASLLGLVFAGFILVKFMFPALVEGQNPVLVGLIGSSAIMFVVLYAAHGFSARTTTALVGTLFGLVINAVLGYVATRWAHLTGVAAEDDYVLSAAAPDLQLTSVVLCGIIVAGLGVLNDVTITQASAVWELADGHLDERGRPAQGDRHLFTRAMRIGRDHIASTVYTIAFATAGASLSVLLLIAIYNRPLLQVLQTEQFAGEVIRTLVGSIGLVLAVPLTTAIGVAVVRASGRPPAEVRAAAAGAGNEQEGLAQADAETQVIPAARTGLLRRRVEAVRAERAAAAKSTKAGMQPAEPKASAEREPVAAPEPPAAEPKPVVDPVADVISDAAERPARRRWRKQEDDDFNFSDLHDPDDTRPGRRRP